MLFMDIEDPLMFFAVKYHEGRAGSPESDQLTGATFLGRLVLGLLILGRLKNGNKKMRLSVSICMLMLLTAPQAFGQAVPRDWNNSAGDKDFTNLSNWGGSPVDFDSEPNGDWRINLNGASRAELFTTIPNVVRDVKVGRQIGDGELYIGSSGSLSTRDVYVGTGNASGKGVLTVDSGGALTATRDLNVGNAQAEGRVFIEGGTVTVARNVRLGEDGLTNGYGQVTVNSGTLNVNGSGGLFVGQSNRAQNLFTLTNGTVTVLETLNVAHQTDTQGVLVINNGSITARTGAFGFGTNSTASLNITGGSLNTTTSFLTFGQGATSNTTVTMSGGTINTDRFNIGNKNADPALPPTSAVLNMSGGTIEAAADIASTAGNRGAFVLGSTVPVVNLSGTAFVSAERLLINAGGSIDLAGTALLHLKGSTIETAPGSGVLASTSPTFSFAQQFFSGLWAEVLGKVNFSSLDSTLRVAGASETIANPTLGGPDLVLNFEDLFNAAISNSVFTSSLSGATFVVEFDGTHTIVRLESSVPPAQIVNRFTFHAGFSGLGSNIDSGKVLAKEGAGPQPLDYVNLINTSRGINGIGFDIQDLAGSLTAADFDFQISPLGAFVEGSNPPAGWAVAPAPSTVTVIAGAPSRVLVEWANQSIMNRWLRITVKANANTGLTAPEVFYLGHLLGETTGSQSGPFTVAFADITPIRSVVGGVVNANSIHDIDKNGTVSFADISAMRPNVGAQLTNITIP